MTHAGRFLALVLLAGVTVQACAQEAAQAPLPPDPPAEAPASPAVAPDPEPAKDAAPAKDSAFRLEDLAWRKGPVSIVPFGVGIFNVNYNTKTLFPGSYSLYANPGDQLDRSQFEMSPQNSFLGVDITGPNVGDAKTGGRIDFDFRGPNPVDTDATPYFFEIFGEMKTDRWRLVLGQAKDVISPLDPEVLNFTMGTIGYMPGDIGFFRAQAQLDLYFPLSDEAQLIWQGSINQQVVQALQATPDLFGNDAGWPDVQGRLALALGELTGTTRPTEVGISAFIGERVLTETDPELLRHYRTWSINADFRSKLTETTSIAGEYYMGAVLGSYNGGIFQGIDPVTLNAIRATGGWVELQQKFNDSLRGHLGLGIDDADQHDLSIGRRTSNTAYWGNLYWSITPQLTWAVEVSWWLTRYIEAPDGSATRIETAVMYRF